MYCTVNYGICTLFKAPPWGFCLNRLSLPWGICSCSRTKWPIPKQMLRVGGLGDDVHAWNWLSHTELPMFWGWNDMKFWWCWNYGITKIFEKEFNEVINNPLFLFIPWFSWRYLLWLNHTWNCIFPLNLRALSICQNWLARPFPS